MACVGSAGLHRHRRHDHHLRRYLTLSEGALRPPRPSRCRTCQRAGNPWGLRRRAPRWAHASTAHHGAGKEVEYLYWVGCSASYDKRQPGHRALVVAILKKAGCPRVMRRSVPGEVGRLGEEYLTRRDHENVEHINRTSSRRSSALPALLHTIRTIPAVRRTYESAPLPGVDDSSPGRIKPIKHRQRHRRLPRLVLPRPLPTASWTRRAPRGAVPGLTWSTAERRERGLCCGAAGGHMWMEVKSEKR